MTDLLKACAKPATKQIKVIPQLLCRLQKGIVGHHHGRRKIASQCHSQQRATRRVLYVVIGTFRIKPLGLADQRQLDKQMKLSLRSAQRLTEQDFPAVMVIAAQL